MDIIRPVYNNALWGKGSSNSKFDGKITNILLLQLIKYIDTKHAKGKKVACRDILNFPQDKHTIYCSKPTLSQDMLEIGISYKPRKKKAHNNNIECLDQIR